MMVLLGTSAHRGDCLRDIGRFHALGLSPFHGLPHLGLGLLLFGYRRFVALIFVDDMDLLKDRLGDQRGGE
jgi:hypothetical protein